MEQTSPINRNRAMALKFIAFRTAKQAEPPPGSTNTLLGIRPGSNINEAVFNRLSRHLRQNLRSAGPDKINPPILRTLTRTGTPDNSTVLKDCPNQVIHAVLLLCYQDRICRTEAYRRIAAWYGGNEHTLRNVFQTTASAGEKAYNPYSPRRNKRQATQRHFSRK